MNKLYLKKFYLNSESISRRLKLFKLRIKYFIFFNNFYKNIVIKQIILLYNCINNINLIKLNILLNISGRVINKIIIGKVSFIILQDISGKIQLYLSLKDISYSKFKLVKDIDIGDIIGVFGLLFKTRTGELSLRCFNIFLLTKSLCFISFKFYGLINKEIKYRKRYLDMIINYSSFNIFKVRSNILFELRNFLYLNKFIEVETPMMHYIPGGAFASPFITYHNELNINMFLRISPELFLKKLIVGGFERIFEINRNFRNEGLSYKHNTEFTMIELYISYADYFDLILLVEDFFKFITFRICGTNIVKIGNSVINFNSPFIKMTMKEAICFYCPNICPKMLNNMKYIIKFAKCNGIFLYNWWSLGRMQYKIFEDIVEKKIIQPTFITSFPIEVSPLAKRNYDNVFYTDRFEIFINGFEIGNGFSELSDPEDQAMRFYEQSQIKIHNDNDYNIFYDSDYITALEYGLPPTAGLGLGVDRIVMLLTNLNNIRDVILFPTLRVF